MQTALPDLEGIKTFERPEEGHRYMIYEYADGLNVPSWLVSDGTLRLTALTLPAYLIDLEGIYLIEEPENGIHPGAVSTAYDSLSSMYEAQVLLATHSTVVLNAAELDDVLCFAKDETGATDIVLGSEHPMLRNWQGQVDLGDTAGGGGFGMNKRELVILVADKDMAQALKGILERPEALGIRGNQSSYSY